MGHGRFFRSRRPFRRYWARKRRLPAPSRDVSHAASCFDLQSGADRHSLLACWLLWMAITRRTLQLSRLETTHGTNQRRIPQIHKQSHRYNQQQNPRAVVEATNSRQIRYGSFQQKNNPHMDVAQKLWRTTIRIQIQLPVNIRITRRNKLDNNYWLTVAIRDMINETTKKLLNKMTGFDRGITNYYSKFNQNLSSCAIFILVHLRSLICTIKQSKVCNTRLQYTWSKRNRSSINLYTTKNHWDSKCL